MEYARVVLSWHQARGSLSGVRVPELGSDWGYRYEKFHRTAQALAIVGVAALARRSNGHVAEARTARPAADGTEPPADLRGAPDHRRHLAQVLTGRALAAAAGA